ncbi:MAG: hypothetical protein O3B31_12090 [Chloroflexi bacterium]|nr:hypothetical protein [Chloroflexota bacterium]MDA1004064.1 hypothetical protein [Chloroflexota bacterium]
MRRIALILTLTLVGLAAGGTGLGPVDPVAAGDPGDALITRVNDQLQAMGLTIRLGELEYFTIGEGRPPNRILKQPFRWVSDDPRRLASGDALTYLVDGRDGATATGLTAASTEAAIDSAVGTWAASKPLAKLSVLKVPAPGADPNIFDGIIAGDLSLVGFPFFADITHAGWLPKSFFDALAPSGGNFILAVSVTFIFIDTTTVQPTDINNDQHLDTALNEVYYNDNFGDPGGTRPLNPWGINVGLPSVDVETVASHESGHSLGVGHFGPPPSAVMNPIYAGIQHSPAAIDLAGMSSVFRRWPR